MDQHLNYAEEASEGIRALGGLEDYVRNCGLEPGLLELMKIRVSQLNGCGYCIDMHTQAARANGETEQRLSGLSAWRESELYTSRERAALAWAVAVTLVSHQSAPDTLYEESRRYFSEKELVDLTLALVAINGWNRLSIAFRAEPETTQPRARLPVGVESQEAGLT